MEAAPSGDQIGQLLHVVVIEICQRIVSYTSELVISGLISVTADGVEVSRIPFADAVQPKTCGSPHKNKGEFFRHSVSSRASPVGSEDFPTLDCIGDIDDVETRVEKRRAKSETDTTGCKNGRFTDVMVDDRLSSKLIRDLVASDCTAEGKTLGRAQIPGVVCGVDSSVSNLGEMVIECWQRLTPELLRASTLLCQLGELQKLICGGNQLPVLDCHASSLRPHPNFKRSKFNSHRNHNAQSSAMNVSSKFQPSMLNFHAKNQCRFCQKVFTFTTNLIRHQRKFHGRPNGRVLRDANGSKILSGRKFSVNSSNLGGGHIGMDGVKEIFRPAADLIVKDLVLNENAVEQDEKDVANFDISPNVSATCRSREIMEIDFDEDPAARDQCVDEELEICDDENEVNNDTGCSDCALTAGDTVCHALAVSEAVDVTDNTGNDQCQSWNNGDSARSNLSIDVCDDDSSPYFDESCSFVAAESNETMVVSADSSACSKTSDSDAINVGSPESVNSDPISLRVKKFDCSMCSASFSMSSNLQRHVKKVHGTSKQTQSTRVSPSFSNALDVLNGGSDMDVRNSRSSRYRHVCVVCQAAFTFRTNLTRHMKKIHGKIPLDTSDRCNVDK